MEDIMSMKLGPYRLTRLLARGGMSEVYLASDERDEQVYALKVVRQSNEEYCQRFQHEAKTLMFLHHPHILPLLDCGIEEDLCYYVTPYISNGTLKNRISKGALHEEEIEKILSEVASALHFLHKQGFVHRDIKSSNILLDETNHAWLADFGLAMELEGGSDFTLTGNLMGTPSYMAPELGYAQATVKSDIYALGVVLYEMVTGQLPFKGGTAVGIYWKQVYEQPPDPLMLKPLLSPPLKQVILRALEKDPRDRYSSAQAMAEAYQQALLIQPLVLGEVTITIKSVKALRRQLAGQGRRVPLAPGVLASAAFLTLCLGCLVVLAHDGQAFLSSNAVQAIAAPVVIASPTPTPQPQKGGSQTPVPAGSPVHSTTGAQQKSPQKPPATHEPDDDSQKPSPPHHPHKGDGESQDHHSGHGEPSPTHHSGGGHGR
ncbi:MAG TPA: protein kinase [Ktedonobacteraceae bacterium]